MGGWRVLLPLRPWGDFSVQYQNLPRDLRGKMLRLLGFGRIGSALAEVCHGSFGMKILAHDPLLPSHLRECYASWVTFVDRVPLNEQTRTLRGEGETERMEQDASLINTARGAVLDEEALADALNEGRIAGAGLDVLEEEPLSPGSPLLDLIMSCLTPLRGPDSRVRGPHGRGGAPVRGGSFPGTQAKERGQSGSPGDRTVEAPGRFHDGHRDSMRGEGE